MAKKDPIKARVTVYPRQEILDPQGQAIGGALARLGYSQVRAVRAGKSFEIVLDGVDAERARELLDEMGAKLLANPIVEDFHVECPAGELP